MSFKSFLFRILNSEFNIVKKFGGVVTVSCLVIILAANSMFASTGDYGSNSIFMAGTGSRALSMGSAFTALSDDSSGLYYNPAGVVKMERQQISLLHYPLYEGTLYNSITYSQPILDIGSLGAALYRVYTGDIITYDATDTKTGTMTFEEYKATISYATRINDMISVGANVNFFNMSISNISAFGVGADVGAMYTPFSFMSVGAMVHNLMKPTLAMQDAREDLPGIYTLGVLFTGGIEPVTANLTCDVSLGDEMGLKLKAGLEVRVFRMISVRGGFDDGLVSFGGGFEYLDASLDYAYVNNEFLGGLSRFTLSYKFGLTLEEQAAEREAVLKEQVKKLVEAEFKRKEIASSDKYYVVAEKYYKEKKYEKAKEELAKAFEWSRDNEKAIKLEKLVDKQIMAKYFKSAMAQYKKQNYISAMEGFKEVAKIDAKYNSTNVYLERIDNKLKMKGNAKKYFSEGVELYVNKQYDEAITKWRSALKISPGNATIKSYIAKAEAKKRVVTGSAKVSPEQKEKAKKMYYSGLKKYTAGDIEGAVIIWKSVLKIDSEDIKTLKAIDKAQAEMEELKKRGIKQ